MYVLDESLNDAEAYTHGWRNLIGQKIGFAFYLTAIERFCSRLILAV